MKEEIYRVAARHRVRVSVVSNSPFRVPVGPLVERVVVHGGFDAADDWIAQRADPRAVVVTADILLADDGRLAADVVDLAQRIGERPLQLELAGAVLVEAPFRGVVPGTVEVLLPTGPVTAGMCRGGCRGQDD